MAKLLIDDAGAVTSNGDGGSNVPDTEVVACVRDELGKLRCPACEASSTATVILSLELRAPRAQ